jgi:hypothetical protein
MAALDGHRERTAADTFGVAMAISFGLKSPVDYSVFSASAAAFLLALNEPRTPGGKL